jgi:hypothetical protein
MFINFIKKRIVLGAEFKTWQYHMLIMKILPFVRDLVFETDWLIVPYFFISSDFHVQTPILIGILPFGINVACWD